MSGRFIAILSSPIVAWDGTYESTEVPFPSAGEIAGVPHYVGHPATREILDSLGASYTPGAYQGPAVGEAFLAVPLDRSPRTEGAAFTVDVAIQSVKDLKARLVKRIA